MDGRTQTGNDPLWMNKMHFEHKLLLRHGFTQGQHLYYMHHHFAFLFIILQCPSGTEGGIPKRVSEKVHIVSPQFKVLSGRVSKYFPSFLPSLGTFAIKGAIMISGLVPPTKRVKDPLKFNFRPLF